MVRNLYKLHVNNCNFIYSMFTNKSASVKKYFNKHFLHDD